ncbi:I-kappaB kinase epsilon isoform X2 [Oratosquilla oratoria]
MSFLRGSANYVWCTTSVLGKGATGAVFQGVNRHTGEPVAVKTFNQLSHMRPHEVQMREFEVLQKVNHENIVKLLAIEEEQEGRGRVIVMELCTGGSLFNILDDPENSYGLEESEFLLVLQHLAAGMKHLRDNNLVHRDLKPGNIMKFIDVDGSTIYKLTDFGAARELQDDQQFMSLYGTEEYLHPDMYERAVLRKPVGKTFGVRVDLWSIGVTLYHVATGQLPFRPYGGRRNKETMYLITTEKAQGVISGVQTSENGPIEWSTDLPETCQLSLGLRKLVTPLLGGLLEVDPQKMWNFEKFFQEVTALLNRKVLHLFFVNKVQPLTIYMESNHKYEELQCLVCEQTDMSPVDQLVLYDNKHFTEIIDKDLEGRSYPSTTPHTPLVLFCKQNDDVTLTLPEVPAVKFTNFPASVSVEHDAATGKAFCSVGHAIKRKIDYYTKCVQLIEYSVLMFIEVIVNQLKSLQNRLGHIQDLTTAISDRFSQLVANHRRFMMLTQMIGGNQESITPPLRERLEDLVNNKVDTEKEVRDSLNAVVPVVNQLYERVVTGGQLRKQWQQANVDVASIERAPNKANSYVTKLRESWQHLLRDRAARTLTFNDEQFHLLEKMKMKETAKSLEALSSTVTGVLHHTNDNLADWCKVAQVQRVQTEIEETDVEKHSLHLQSFQSALSDTEEKYHHTLSDLLASIKDKKLQDDSRLQSEDSDTSEGKEVKERGSISQPCFKCKLAEQEKRKVKEEFRELWQIQDEVMKLVKVHESVVKQMENVSYISQSSNKE